MLTLQVDGVLQMQTMQTIFYQGLVLLFVMLTALWCGAVSFRLKLHYQLLRPNTLPCLMPFVIPFQSRTLSKRLAALFCYWILSRISASQIMRTIFLLFAWQNHWNEHLAKKHIVIKYHHICSRVQTSSNKLGDIKLKYISTTLQLADILTWPVDNDIFFKLWRMMCGDGDSYEFFFVSKGVWEYLWCKVVFKQLNSYWRSWPPTFFRALCPRGISANFRPFAEFDSALNA